MARRRHPDRRRRAATPARRRRPLVERAVVARIGSARAWGQERPRRPRHRPPRRPSPPTRRSSARAIRLSPHGILALQRSIGNAAVAALVARRIHGEDVPERPPPPAPTPGPRRRSSAIQRELKRLGLYSYTIDGDRGPKTNAGLTAAFDSEAWQSMGATEVHEKLKAAKKPDDPGGTRAQLRRAVQGRRARRHVRRRLLRGQPAGRGDAPGGEGRHGRARSRAATRRTTTPPPRSSTRPAARCRRRAPGSSSSSRTRSATARRPASRARSTRSSGWSSTTSPAVARAASAAFREGMARRRRGLVLRPRPLRHRPGLRPQLHRVPPLRQGRQAACRRSTTTSRSRRSLRPGRQGPVEGLPGPDRGQDAPGRPLQRRQRAPGR